VGTSLPGREFRAGEKGGSGVGKTKISKGSKVMVADGHGLPIGLCVDGAQLHESQLAEATPATVRVPQQGGRPRTRPKALVLCNFSFCFHFLIVAAQRLSHLRN
jgi:hypothetical protein